MTYIIIIARKPSVATKIAAVLTLKLQFIAVKPNIFDLVHWNHHWSPLKVQLRTKKATGMSHRGIYSLFTEFFFFLEKINYLRCVRFCHPLTGILYIRFFFFCVLHLYSLSTMILLAIYIK